MDLEFQESDIIFADDRDQLIPGYDHEDHHYDCYTLPDHILVPVVYNNSRLIHINLKRDSEAGATNSSPPMVIPESCVLRRSLEHWDDHSMEEDGEDDGGKSMVPPHEIVGRRIAGKMTSSAYARNGRILKGRYLSEVRNSILRMTGFLES